MATVAQPGRFTTLPDEGTLAATVELPRSQDPVLAAQGFRQDGDVARRVVHDQNGGLHRQRPRVAGESTRRAPTPEHPFGSS